MKSPSLRVDLYVALFYLIFGVVWILLSDFALNMLAADRDVLVRWQTLKGWVFVAVSALVIFLILRRELKQHHITERQLDESEEIRNQLFMNSMDAILLTVPDGRILAANPAACQMFGRTEEEIVRIGRSGLVDTSDPRLQAALEERARTGRFHGELTYLRADGTTFEGEVATNVFKSRQGEDRTSMVIRDVTGRKQMEDALRASEERYKLISSVTSDYMFYSRVDAGGQSHLEWVAGAFEGITGYGFEEYIASGGWRAAVHPDDLAVDDRDMEKLRSGRRAITEIRTIAKGGGVRWVQVYALPVMDPEYRQLLGIYGAVQEITERKLAEKAREENEELFRSTFEQAAVGWALTDLDGKFIRVNPAYQSITGFSNDELSRMRFIEITHPDDQEHNIQLIQQVLNRETRGFVIEKRYIKKTGEPVWVRNSVAGVRGMDGELVRLVAVCEDITERKQTEDELKRALAFIEKTFASLSEAILVINPSDRTVITCNPAVERIFGYKPEEIIGRSTEFLHVNQDLYEQFGKVGEPVLTEKGLFQTEYSMRRKDGGIILTDNTVTTLLDDKGWMSGVVSVVRDITERKRAEEELRLSRDRLTELTRRLAEAREAEARAIGRELHDQIGQMLTAMKITLDLAGQLPPETAAKKIEQAQELASDLLNRVSRLSLELRPPMLDDLGLLPALVWHVNHYQDGTGIQVDFKHGGVEGVRFPSEIETTVYRIVQEALTNVACHARAQRVRLEVHAGGGWMEIRIDDDGVSFDAESALAKNRGLSGMKERAELVGGTFQIESEKGKGTQKFIRLPLQDENE